MSIKPIQGGRSRPTSDPSAVLHATADLSQAQSALVQPTPAQTSTNPSAAAAAKPLLTAREIELRHAVSKNTPLLASVPHLVSPVTRADIDYLQMAATSADEARRARTHTDQLLDDYLSASLDTSRPAVPALEVQLWASIAFEFDHLQAQATALTAMQSVNRSKLDYSQRQMVEGPPAPALAAHVQQAMALDQKLDTKRNEIELAIACRDALLEERLTKLGLMSSS